MKRGICLAVLSTLVVLLSASDASAAALLTIEPSRDAIAFTDKISIDGALSTDAGIAAGGHAVRLYEKRYPYEESSVIATTTTDAQGEYHFPRVKPEYNSRYRVAIGDETVSVRSASKFVVVYARFSIKTEVTKKFEVVSSFRFLYSKELPLDLSGRRVLWYFHRIGTKRFVVRDETRAERAKSGGVVGHTRFHIPRGTYRFAVTICIDGPNKRDSGLGPPTNRHRCPRSFPARTTGRISTAALPAPGPAPSVPALAGTG